MRTVEAFNFYLGRRLYFNLNQISTYFVNKFPVIFILYFCFSLSLSLCNLINSFIIISISIIILYLDF